MGNPFAKMPGMAGVIKQAQQSMKATEAVEAELENARLEGQSGSGTAGVMVLVNGKGSLLELKIGKDLVDPKNVDMLEDMVSIAVRDAIEKANNLRTEKLQKVIPGGISGLF